MQARILTIGEKKLVGLRMKMSFANNRTAELWRSFMPRRKEIVNGIGTDLFSLQIYSPSFFLSFDPASEFEKWALAEVSDFSKVPDGMEKFVLATGLYAVFVHRGSSNDMSTFRYVFSEWLPSSDYILDDRPHFEILSSKYKNNDITSEEEIWIPVKLKNNL